MWTKTWNILIDITTAAWLGIFILSLARPAHAWWTAPASAVIGAIYLAELAVIFRKSAGWRDFLRRAWLDLLMLIPFVRILRIGRVARLLRIKRLARLVGKNRRLSRILRAESFQTLQEGADLVQKTAERLSRLSFR